MRFEFSIAIFLCAVLYFGQVVGLWILCENSYSLKEVKKYAYMVPIIKVVMVVECIKDCIKEKSVRWLIAYLFMKDKNVVIICTLADLLPELHKIDQRKKVKKMQRRQRSVSVSVWKSLFGNDEDVFSYGYQV